MIDNAIRKACSIPRRQAINFIARTPSNKRPVFVATFDPRLPAIQNITLKHWRAMKRIDPHMAEVFPEPPLIAYKRQENIRDKIIRAKLQQGPKLPKEIPTGHEKM